MNAQNPLETADSVTPEGIPSLEIALVTISTIFISLFLGAATFLTLGTGPGLIVGEIFFLIVPLAYLLIKRINIRSYIRINLASRYILAGIAFGVVLIFVNIALSAALTAIFGQSQTVQQSNQLILNLAATSPGLAAVATSLFLAGICEEFFFRGFLQSSLTRKYRFLPAALFSAIAFGLVHFDPQLVYTISAFAAGLVLAYIYHRWNYITSATAHATMNLIVLTLLLLTGIT